MEVEVVGTATAARHRVTVPVVAYKVVKDRTKTGTMAMTVAVPEAVAVVIWVVQVVLQSVGTKVLIQVQMVQIWYPQAEVLLQPVLHLQLLYKVPGKI